MIPALFVAHGSPMVALEDSEYGRYLDGFGQTFPRPKAIVLFSAHWENGIQTVSDVQQYSTIYDFGGFPDELYHIQYPAKGDATLSGQIQQLFTHAEVPYIVETRRGLDHGAWTILHRIYPDADIPVISMSINPNLSHRDQYNIGKALAPLREQDVLIIGSGVTIHNFRTLNFGNRHAVVDDWALEFETWLEHHLNKWDLESLFHFESIAPHARLAAPQGGDEHFVPIFYSMGAADEQRCTKLLYRSFEFGNLSNSIYQFG